MLGTVFSNVHAVKLFYEITLSKNGADHCKTTGGNNPFVSKLYDNLFIHDDARNASDVKVYEFRPKSQTTFSDNYRLDKLISSRVMCGGTSHKGVFDLMEVYITDVTNTNKKYNIQYCLIASDLYSDIEEIYKNYKWINLINNNIFAITPTMDASLPFGKVIHIS